MGFVIIPFEEVFTIIGLSNSDKCDIHKTTAGFLRDLPPNRGHGPTVPVPVPVSGTAGEATWNTSSVAAENSP